MTLHAASDDQNPNQEYSPRVVAVLASRDVSVGDGWTPIVAELLGELTVVAPDIEFVQIKQKFGGLRVYHDSQLTGPDAGVREAIVEALIAVAAERCSRTCEMCGAAGRHRASNHWTSVVCAACAEAARASGRRGSFVTPAETELIELLGASASTAIAVAVRSARASARAASATIDRMDAAVAAATMPDPKMWLTSGRPANINRLVSAAAVLAAFGESAADIDDDIARCTATTAAQSDQASPITTAV